jgi:DHA1 family tetracycline resistance protein-like MFS transporter
MKISTGSLKSIAPLLWVVLTDSLGWGIAFSASAALILNTHSHFLPTHYSSGTRYMLYELLLAIYSVFTFLFSPVLGGISDYYGRRPALKIAMAGLTGGFILCGLGCILNSLWLLFLGRVVSGMTAGSVSVAQAAIVDMSTPESKASYLSMMTLFNCLGMSVGPVLGGLIVAIEPGPVGMVTFLVAALISTIGFIGIIYLFKETYFPNNAEKKLNILEGFLNIKIALYKPVVKYYLFVFLFSMIAYGLCFSNIPVFLLREFSSSTSTIGMVLGEFGVFLSLSLIVGGKYVFRLFSVHKVVLSCLFIQLCMYLVFSLCIHSFLLNCIVFACVALTVAQLYVGLLTLISNSTEPHWQGRIMGVVASLFAVPWAVGPILAGGLNHLSAGAAFLCSALLVVLSLGLLRLVKHQTGSAP